MNLHGISAPWEDPDDKGRPETKDNLPHTPDDQVKDQGTTESELSASKQGKDDKSKAKPSNEESANAKEEDYRPTDFDIDESTG